MLGSMGRQRAPREEKAEGKTCRSCGRRMEARQSWRGHGDEVRYCSDSCRRHRVTATDRRLEATILELLRNRAASATVCPSEAARLVAGERTHAAGPAGVGPAQEQPGDEAWRALMEPARRAARRLVASGDVVIVQGGRVVDPSTAKGPIRIRRV